jgi:predicted MPP superfamily phosphohydrolase
MRGALGFVGFIVVLYGGSALVHFALWRWLRAIAPRFVARRKTWLLAALAFLFVLPMGRDISILFPQIKAGRSLAAVGMLWHITVWLSMTAVGVVRALAYVPRLVGNARAALVRAKRAAPRAATEPDAVGDPRPLPEPESAEPRPARELRGDIASPDRRLVLERIGGAAAFVASSGALAWGALRGRYEWTVEEVPIRLPQLPRALDGFTIVQLSDLHVGTFVGERELAMGLGLVDNLRPDLVVITGDIVDVDAHFVPLAAARLGALKSRFGSVCIPGNHDYYTGVRAVLDGMRRAGVEVLSNRGKIIAAGDGGFALIGVDDLSARHRGGTGPDIARARDMVPPGLATILLAHQPTFAPIAASFGVDLQLSGHTHGGQINPGFRPIDLFFRYVAGRYDVGAMQLYVNRGFGTAGPPARLGAPPEITKIVLVAS